MRRVFLLILLCISNSTVKAQDSFSRIKIYNARISLINNPHLFIRGTRYDITDTSLIVSPKILGTRFYDNLILKEVYYFDINTIKIRKKDSPLIELGIGALAGGLIGFATGYSGGDDPPGWFSFTAEGKGLAVGLLGASVGGLIGLAVGFASIEIPIGGSFDNFFNNALRLKSYSIKMQQSRR
jgi:hypothetical protein